jgi:hypothetical protein
MRENRTAGARLYTRMGAGTAKSTADDTDDADGRGYCTGQQRNTDDAEDADGRGDGKILG